MFPQKHALDVYHHSACDRRGVGYCLISSMQMCLHCVCLFKHCLKTGFDNSKLMIYEIHFLCDEIFMVCLVMHSLWCTNIQQYKMQSCTKRFKDAKTKQNLKATPFPVFPLICTFLLNILILFYLIFLLSSFIIFLQF